MVRRSEGTLMTITYKYVWLLHQPDGSTKVFARRDSMDKYLDTNSVHGKSEQKDGSWLFGKSKNYRAVRVPVQDSSGL